MLKVIIPLLGAYLLFLSPVATDTTAPNQYTTCINNAGRGHFVVNTSTGEIFWSDTNSYRSLGKPENAKAGRIGTYTITPNNAGRGVFLTNTETGESWWTGGKKWRSFGIPTSKYQTE